MVQWTVKQPHSLRVANSILILGFHHGWIELGVHLGLMGKLEQINAGFEEEAWCNLGQSLTGLTQRVMYGHLE